MTAKLEKCPMGCRKYEASLHYLQCTHNPHPAEMTQGISGIRKWMRSNETSPALTSIMTRILKHYINNNIDDLEEWDFENEPNKVWLHQLVKSQAEIGWESIFKGRISIEWRNLQNIYLHETEDIEKPRLVYRTATYWASCLIQQIVYFTLNTWQIRNDKLHEDKVETEKNAKWRSIISQVATWYTNAQTSRPAFRDHNLFTMSFLQRKTRSIPMLESWIATVKEQHNYLDHQDNEADHEQRQRQARRDGRQVLRGQPPDCQNTRGTQSSPESLN